jgi:hypothetical protein
MKCNKCKNDPVRIERCEIARVDSWTNIPCVAPTQIPLGAKPIDITKVTYCAPLPYKKIVVPTPPPPPPPPPPERFDPPTDYRYGCISFFPDAGIFLISLIGLTGPWNKIQKINPNTGEIEDIPYPPGVDPAKNMVGAMNYLPISKKMLFAFRGYTPTSYSENTTYVYLLNSDLKTWTQISNGTELSDMSSYIICEADENENFIVFACMRGANDTNRIFVYNKNTHSWSVYNPGGLALYTIKWHPIIKKFLLGGHGATAFFVNSDGSYGGSVSNPFIYSLQAILVYGNYWYVGQYGGIGNNPYYKFNGSTWTNIGQPYPTGYGVDQQVKINTKFFCQANYYPGGSPRNAYYYWLDPTTDSFTLIEQIIGETAGSGTFKGTNPEIAYGRVNGKDYILIVETKTGAPGYYIKIIKL